MDICIWPSAPNGRPTPNTQLRTANKVPTSAYAFDFMNIDLSALRKEFLILVIFTPPWPIFTSQLHLRAALRSPTARPEP